MKVRILLIYSILFSVAFVKTSFAQKQKTQTAVIKTSAECAVCKKKIETTLAAENGIKRSTVDVENKTVTVTYDSRKTNKDKIRMAIVNAGYDADSIPANNKAVQQVKEFHK